MSQHSGIMLPASVWTIRLDPGEVLTQPAADLLLAVAGDTATLRPRDPATWVRRSVSVDSVNPPEQLGVAPTDTP
jgi:hypothetical protein